MKRLCTKRRHATKAHARIHMRRLGQARRERYLYVYECPHCGFYHVGHMTGQQIRRYWRTLHAI